MFAERGSRGERDGLVSHFKQLPRCLHIKQQLCLLSSEIPQPALSSQNNRTDDVVATRVAWWNFSFKSDLHFGDGTFRGWTCPQLFVLNWSHQLHPCFHTSLCNSQSKEHDLICSQRIHISEMRCEEEGVIFNSFLWPISKLYLCHALLWHL